MRGKAAHFKTHLLSSASHLCCAQLMDSFKSSVCSHFQTRAGAPVDAIFVLKAASNPKAMEAHLITWHLNPIKTYHKGKSARVKTWCNLPKPLPTADTHHRNLSIHLRSFSYISDYTRILLIKTFQGFLFNKSKLKPSCNIVAFSILGKVMCTIIFLWTWGQQPFA